MATTLSPLPEGVQTVPASTDAETVIRLLKRDGGVFVKGLVAEKDIDTAYADCKARLDSDVAWEGEFFPSQTQRAPHLIALSPTYTHTQLMHPLYRAICAHFLTTRSHFWWGDQRKESVSHPYAHSSVALRIGPGATAQPLHRDDYIAHNMHAEIDAWDDERDARRETAVGLFVAGTEVTKRNGGTAFIPGSHLWSTHRSTPPSPDQCIYATLSKGDAFIMLASAYHGGGANTTADEHRLVFSTFVTRGFLRQEENQFLAVPPEVARGLYGGGGRAVGKGEGEKGGEEKGEKEEDEKEKERGRAVLRYIGYSLSDPACGTVEQMDPIYAVFPEEKEGVGYKDF